jgi:hypothetical protein
MKREEKGKREKKNNSLLLLFKILVLPSYFSHENKSNKRTKGKEVSFFF